MTARQGWLKCLEVHCAELRGHRLVWRKDADPYHVKLVRSAQAKQAGRLLPHTIRSRFT
jgi:hypothetical protein